MNVAISLTAPQAIALSQLLSASANLAEALCIQADSAGDKTERQIQYAAASHYRAINDKLERRCRKVITGW